MSSESSASSWQHLRRLPGRAPSVRMSSSQKGGQLWMDDRQLVQEAVHNHTQEIHRFAFEDIQAIQLRRTPRGMIYNIILGVLLVWLLLITLFADDPLDLRLAWGAGLGLPLLVLLIINLARGPTCRTVLTTALGPQHLPSLSRVGATRRALTLIAANVAAVQGTLQPDDAAREVDRARSGVTYAAQAAPGGKLYQNYDY